jgi:flagellar biosynthesis/type III secretory pathway M-ring protein FliF/YscJ
VTAVIIVIVAVVVVAIIVALVLRARRPDTVEVFQRQIDALSPEARKPVVEQLQQLDERSDDQAPEESGAPPAEDDEGGG